MSAVGNADAKQAQDAVERVVRLSYARLLAYLAARTRNIDAAEDALAEAFAAALETWPERGVPGKPEAWLMQAAKNKIHDRHRHGKVIDDAQDILTILTAELAETTSAFPDERLKLLFICAHPAIDASIRTPLMLQTVLGLDAARIASAFLTAPVTMSQRLVRAKHKIRVARIRFDVPAPQDLPERLDAVLDAIYAAFGTGWDDATGGDPKRRGLSTEAIWLARLLTTLVPDAPEAKGLLALMLHSEARRHARRNALGDYVPISKQDTTLWDHGLIREAEEVLRRAFDRPGLGRYRLEAAIQSAHAERILTGRDNWPAIVELYDRLIAMAPSIGALVSRAAALGEALGADAGIEALTMLPADRVQDYQPYWAVAADLWQRSGDRGRADQAYERAIGLAEDGAVRRYLLSRQQG